MAWQKKIEVRESNALSNIDGFLVTDGSQVRVTLRASLPSNEKLRGKEALIEQMRATGAPGVYLWNRFDRRAQYSGSDTRGW